MLLEPGTSCKVTGIKKGKVKALDVTWIIVEAVGSNSVIRDATENIIKSVTEVKEGKKKIVYFYQRPLTLSQWLHVISVT